ncbi:MAG: glycosyltransferase family A protein [Algibacter sp.]
MINGENKESKLEILISTMYKTSLSFLSAMFSNDDYLNYTILIVNQTTQDKLLISNYNNIRVINSFSRGLSLSRNIAINNALMDICLLADDDVSYVEGFSEIIESTFERNHFAGVITFQMIDDKGVLYNKYPNVILHNKKTVSTVNSVVIALDRKKIIKNNVFFNENFGLGSIFETADEYVFLRSALRKEIKIFFEPKILLKHPSFSSGRAVVSDKIIYARSAVFYKYNGVITYLKLGWHLFLLIKNNKLKSSKFLKKYKHGLKGINKYKGLLKQGLETRKS